MTNLLNEDADAEEGDNFQSAVTKDKDITY